MGATMAAVERQDTSGELWSGSLDREAGFFVARFASRTRPSSSRHR